MNLQQQRYHSSANSAMDFFKIPYYSYLDESLINDILKSKHPLGNFGPRFFQNANK